MRILEQRIREIESVAGLGSWDWDIENDHVAWSDELFHLFGVAPHSLPLTYGSYLSLLHPDDRASVERILADALLQHKPFAFEHRILMAGGDLRWLRALGEVILNQFGAVQRMHGTAQDITEAARQELEREQQFTKAAFDSMRDLMVACDAEGRFTRFNQAMADFLGVPAAPSPPESWTEYWELYRVDGTPMGLEDSPLLRALRGETVRGLEVFVRTPTGNQRFVVADGQQFFDPAGGLLGAVVVLHDITVQHEAESSLAFQALHDALTGLPNRDLFVDRVRRALHRARRHRWQTALLALNLDHFADINGRLGHDAANQLLAQVARRLEGALRPYDSVSRSLDTVARLGGDQFLLLCEQVGNARDAILVAERVRSALGEPMTLGVATVTLTAGIGITLSRDPGHDPDSLILEAETAMGRAKARGPAHIELFADEMRAQLHTRMASEDALRRALVAGEFRIAYQPKVSLLTGRVVGMEALLRWDHPDRGLVPPLDFIPLAEETGLIVPIGAWVLEQASLQAKAWRQLLPRGRALVVSVNVSVRQFEPRLAQAFAEIITTMGVHPSSLCLEVTESTIMGDAESAITTLRELKALGLKLSIDDFGTGYSSLAYLKRFPLDELKIDKVFIDGLGQDPEATAIVAAVMGMAHALDLVVVAEGVETQEQVERLRALGCDVAQGYYYARPQPAPEIDALLAGEDAGKLLGPRGVGPSTRPSSGRERVLVVDDAADVRQLARASLAAAGFEVHEAESGEAAIALAGRLRPHCIVLDVHLPGISGLEVCRMIRADPNNSGITIVMLTADTEASEKVQAFALDADDYIVKPFSPRELVSRVTSSMRRRREAGEAPV
ncbi:MAG: EAL domain-containing protein [Candidatus Dormibacteria bacterium]